MIDAPVVIERVVRIAPFGVRFFDAASERYIGDLVVSARAASGRVELPMTPSPSGVYALHHGSLAWVEDEANLPGPASYIVTVRDPQGRFVPLELELAAPDGQVQDARLYSAAARPTPEGLAAVRADLFDPLADAPAAGVILEVRAQDELLGRGMSSASGSVVVFFAYPAPAGFAPGSPPASEQTWTLDIAAPDADIWADANRTTRLSTATLRFGQDLILVTAATPSRLLVTPVGSPP